MAGPRCLASLRLDVCGRRLVRAGLSVYLSVCLSVCDGRLYLLALQQKGSLKRKQHRKQKEELEKEISGDVS